MAYNNLKPKTLLWGQRIILTVTSEQKKPLLEFRDILFGSTVQSTTNIFVVSLDFLILYRCQYLSFVHICLHSAFRNNKTKNINELNQQPRFVWSVWFVQPTSAYPGFKKQAKIKNTSVRFKATLPPTFVSGSRFLHSFLQKSSLHHLRLTPHPTFILFFNGFSF